MLTLPPEVLLLVLEAANTLEDVRALILTAPIFNGLWKEHIQTISSKVAERSLVCYPEVGPFTHIFVISCFKNHT